MVALVNNGARLLAPCHKYMLLPVLYGELIHIKRSTTVHDPAQVTGCKLEVVPQILTKDQYGDGVLISTHIHILITMIIVVAEGNVQKSAT